MRQGGSGAIGGLPGADVVIPTGTLHLAGGQGQGQQGSQGQFPQQGEGRELGSCGVSVKGVLQSALAASSRPSPHDLSHAVGSLRDGDAATAQFPNRANAHGQPGCLGQSPDATQVHAEGLLCSQAGPQGQEEGQLEAGASPCTATAMPAQEGCSPSVGSTPLSCPLSDQQAYALQGMGSVPPLPGEEEEAAHGQQGLGGDQAEGGAGGQPGGAGDGGRQVVGKPNAPAVLACRMAAVLFQGDLASLL